MDRMDYLAWLHEFLANTRLSFDDSTKGWWGGQIIQDANGGGTLELDFTSRDAGLDPATGTPEAVTYRWVLTPMGA